MEKFIKTAAAAKVENFEALNEGIWLEEAALENIEAVLTTNEEAAANHATEMQAVKENLTTAEASLATANETIAEHEATIASLNAQIEELKQGPAGSFSNTTKGADEIGVQPVQSFETEYDRQAKALKQKFN